MVIFHLFRSDAEQREIKAMENIEKCTSNIGQTTIETRAYLHALSESKGLNLAKHVAQVEREMDKNMKSQKGYFLSSIHQFIDTHLTSL